MTGPVGDAFAQRVVEVISNKSADGPVPGWTVGSGLLVGPRLILTSAHVLTGTDIRVRGISAGTGKKVSWTAEVIDPGDVDIADIALLRVLTNDLGGAIDDRIDRLPMLGFGRVDRGAATPQVIARCSAVGFPQFKETTSSNSSVVRETAHVTGEIPTLDQLVAGLLTMRVTSSPRPLPALDQPLHRSEWAGMSGAVVTVGNTVLAVVTEHQPRAGQSELTVTPVSHAVLLGPARARIWSAALGADVTDLPVAVGAPAAPIQHFHIARDLVMSQTVLQTFRARPVAPSPPAHFAGRRAELDQLARSLRQGRNVAVTGVQGMGGIGKTALALKLASEMAEFSVVLWASLGPEPSVISHLLNWARHADPDFQTGDTSLDVVAARVRAALTDLVRDHYPGPVLVILDDVWEGAAVTAARLLQSAAPVGSVFLITTRSQIVVAQLRSTRLELAPIEPADALQMLRNLLSAYPDIPAQHLQDLAAVVGYHPLAIELAAGQTQLLERPADEIADLVARYRGGVPAGSPFGQILLELGESREDNLELVLSFSYDTLDEEDRASLCALGVLAYGAPFDRKLCSAIWRQEPEAVIDRLRHRALLGVGPDRGWYQQHPLLRAYARALLRTMPDQCTAVENEYTQFVCRLSSGFAGRSVDRWADLEPYVPHVEETGTLLVDASRAAIEGGRQDDPRLSRMVDFALNTRSLLSARRELEHRDWLECALVVSRQRAELGHVVLFLADIAQQQSFRGDSPGAARTLSDAREVATRTRDDRAVARINLDIGQFFLRTDPDSAARPLRDALDGFDRLGDARGMTLALLMLAEWHAVWPHQPQIRQKAAGLLAEALEIADREGYTDLRGDALIGQGRLRHTFGEAAEAVVVLTDAITVFAGLRNKAREAVARLFLAGSLADLGQMERAEEELNVAIPLFAAVGDAPGQTTALRNLGELYAGIGRPAQALASFAAALPLVHKLTMRFLDEDTEEPSVVPGFFTSHLEQVSGVERSEQFRARIDLGPLDDQVHSAADGDGDGRSGSMADELLGYLLTSTVRAAIGPPADSAEWRAALAEFVERVSAHGDTFRHERDFARALLGVVDGQEPSTDLPSDNPYGPYLATLLLRAEAGHIAGPLLSDDSVERYLGNTFAVLTNAPEHRREWATELRQIARLAHQWGDTTEESYYKALDAVLENRPAGLPAGSPYFAQFINLLEALDEIERRPADVVVEKSVAAIVVTPGQRDQWVETLTQQYRDARRRRSPDESALLAALITLVTSGTAVDLPDTNPHRELLIEAKTAVSEGRPLPTVAPMAALRDLVGAVIEARTTRPKNIDQVGWRLEDQAATAENLGRTAEAELYRTMFEVLHGAGVALLDSMYGSVVQTILQALKDQPSATPAEHSLPDEQIGALVGAAVTAATEANDGAAGVAIADYRAAVASRGSDWQPETDFLQALSDLISGRPPALPPEHLYHSVVADAAETVRLHNAIASRGGQFTGPELGFLIDGTGSRLRALNGVMDQHLSDVGGGTDDFVDMLNRMHDIAMEQVSWKEQLHTYRMEIATAQPDWHDEMQLLAALEDILDGQPGRIAESSPYFERFDELLKTIPPTFGLPDPLATLAATPEEHRKLFQDRVSGRDSFVKTIPTALANTFAVRTSMADRASEWRDDLENRTGLLAEQTTEIESFDAEIELLGALREVASGGRPTLPDDHPYQVELRQVVEGLDLFEGNLSWPGSLSSDEVNYLIAKTCATMSFDSANAEAWAAELSAIRGDHRHQYPDDSETRAFLDALLIVIDDRPTDLPLTNRYWAHLQNIRAQIAALRKSPE